jgi:hypothetical protein
MYIGVKSVNALENYELLLEFDNGEERLFDLKPYLLLGRFAELKEYEKFKNVRVSFDTVEWPGIVDLDPEFLYKESRRLTVVK